MSTQSERAPLSEVVLLNPKAGSGAAARAFQKSKTLLSADHRVLVGSGPQETERLAAQAARDQVARLTIIGGDGTLHHALNGYLSVRETQTKVAIVPGGTANDYITSLRRHADATLASTLTVDVGRVCYPGFERFFFNVAGIGLTGYTAIASRPSAWLPAKARYTLGLLRTLIYGWRYADVTIRLDEKEMSEPQLLTLSVAIGAREGSFTLAPEARMNDGQFNLLIALGLRRRDICRILPGLLVGRLPLHDPRIQYLVTNRLQLRSSTPIHLHLDGEIYGGGTLPAQTSIVLEQASPVQLEILSEPC